MRMPLFLVDVFVHLEYSGRHIYVEVVMRGETEGRFLEDSGAHHWETLGEVSRLGGFWRCVAERDANNPPRRNF